MAPWYLFPLWKRGIKGDLIVVWGGFFLSRSAVLADDGAT